MVRSDLIGKILGMPYTELPAIRSCKLLIIIIGRDNVEYERGSSLVYIQRRSTPKQV